MRWTILALACLACTVSAGDPPRARAINLDTVNTAADEDDPCAPDSLTLFYASKRDETYDIYVSRRTGANQSFPPGKKVNGLSSKDADERSPFVYKLTLFFATNAVPDEKLKDLKNFDIQQRTGERAPLPLPGISEAADELHPFVTSGGKELYFSRKAEEGWVLMRANGPTPGPIGKAKKAGFEPNFHHACVSSNGLTMYLQGPLDKDRIGLFRSKRTKVSSDWSKPEPLVQVNDAEGPRGDMSPCLSADGARLYFASDRPGGKGGLDLWYVLTSQLK